MYKRIWKYIWGGNMGRIRENQMSFRLTDEERIEFEKLVEMSGLTKTEYLRKCALNKEIINLEPIKELVPEMKRQGVNLNQIAKRLNSNGYVDYGNELKNTLEGVKETWRLLRQYLHTLQ